MPNKTLFLTKTASVLMLLSGISAANATPVNTNHINNNNPLYVTVNVQNQLGLGQYPRWTLPVLVHGNQLGNGYQWGKPFYSPSWSQSWQVPIGSYICPTVFFNDGDQVHYGVFKYKVIGPAASAENVMLESTRTGFNSEQFGSGLQLVGTGIYTWSSQATQYCESPYN